jgi:hypothetical protein
MSAAETFLARSCNHTKKAALVTFVTEDNNGIKVIRSKQENIGNNNANQNFTLYSPCILLTN